MALLLSKVGIPSLGDKEFIDPDMKFGWRLATFQGARIMERVTVAIFWGILETDYDTNLPLPLYKEVEVTITNRKVLWFSGQCSHAVEWRLMGFLIRNS
jgi:hypothetical protein